MKLRVYWYISMYVCTYKEFTSLFFCIYPVHISLGQYCQKMLKMEGLKKDRMEGGCPCSSGLVCRRGLKYSARYVKVKGD